jgi:hypothetical protein
MDDFNKRYLEELALSRGVRLPSGGTSLTLEQTPLRSKAGAQFQQSIWPLIERAAEVDGFADAPVYESPVLAGIQAEQEAQALAALPQAQAPQMGGGSGVSMAGYNKAMKDLIDYQLRSQKAGEGEIGSLKERLQKLQAAPTQRMDIGTLLAAGADVWGGGGGTFSKLNQSLNPQMTEAQKAEAIAKLEDTIRKARGDMTASETALLKAQLGFEADKLALQAKAAGKAGSGGESTPQQKLAGLNAEEKKMVGSLGEAFNKISMLKDAAAKGLGPKYIDSSTPLIGKLKSDTEWQVAERLLTEVIARVQTGAAITEFELENFKNMLPRAADSEKIRKQKLKDMETFIKNKIAPLGLTVDDLGAAGLTVGNTGSNINKFLSPEEQAELTALEAKYGGK